MRNPITSNKYEEAPEYPNDAYAIDGYRSVAFTIYGWETEADEDTEWSGMENRTGKLVAVMVGDDRRFTVDPDDVSEIPAEGYCRSCGQIGCAHG